MEKAGKTYLRCIRDLLRQKRSRDETGLFVVEGMKIINDTIQKGYAVQSALFSDNAAGKEGIGGFIANIRAKGIQVYHTGNKDFENLSLLSNPSGVLAIAEKKEKNVTIPDNAADVVVVLCDGVQDPLNLGIIIRTCSAFNIDYLMLTGGSVDIYNPKLLRASAGTVLDIPVLKTDYNDLIKYKENGFQFIVSHFKYGSAVDLDSMEKTPKKTIVVFGSEGKGISQEIISLADIYFRIPMPGNIESLNVTTAAAIAIHALSNGRRQ